MVFSLIFFFRNVKYLPQLTLFLLVFLFLPYMFPQTLAAATDSPGPVPGDTTAAAELVSTARYALINGNQPGARLALDELSNRFPTFHCPERMLLDARWCLADKDSTGFAQLYFEALEVSFRSDDFSALLEDLRPIFTPHEAQQWATLDSPAARTLFVIKFWRSRDPDPISPENPRLQSHYARLLVAQSNYSNPVYGLSRLSRNHGAGQSPRFDPTAPLVDFPFNQPQPKFKRPSSYELGPRGLLYLRHGPPDRVVSGSAPATGEENETWHYGNSSFTFDGLQGSGNFSPVPANDEKTWLSTSGTTDDDELRGKYQHYYAAEFKEPGDSVELEFYQSFPAGSLEPGAEPAAVVALFDTSWQGIAISRSPAHRMAAGGDTLWIAVNRLKTVPGAYYYVLRMDLAPFHPVIRKSMGILQFAPDSINLSGIIFGHPLDNDKTIPNRSTDGLLPRPSLVFTAGEIVSVYFEIYGLKPGREGARQYREVITVSKVEPEDSEQDETFSGNVELLKRWTENRTNSLSFSFDRRAGSRRKIISEYFSVDTSGLEPGNYSLHLEVEDKTTGELREVSWFFDLAAPTGQQIIDSF